MQYFEDRFFIDITRLDGQLFGVSTRGGHYRVIIWNLDEDSQKPAAVLGGVDEEITNIRIIRNGEQILVAGQGQKAVYIWSLLQVPMRTDANEILWAPKQIFGYGIGILPDGSCYILANSEQCLYYWNLEETEKRISIECSDFTGEEVVILNSEFTENPYQLIGRSCEEDQQDRAIWLVERDREQTEPVFHIKKILDNKELFAEEDSIREILAAEICPEGRVLGVLTEKNTILYNSREGKRLAVIPHSSLESLDLRLESFEEEYYLIEFSLWLSEHSSSNKILTGYRFDREGNLQETKSWNAEKHQALQACTLILKDDRREIFYNQHGNPVIYRVEWEKEESIPFFQLPEGMMVVSMRNE